MSDKIINISYNDYRELIREFGLVIFTDDPVDKGTVSRKLKSGNVYRMNIYFDCCRVRINENTTDSWSNYEYTNEIALSDMKHGTSCGMK